MAKIDFVNPVSDIPIDQSISQVLGCTKRINLTAERGFDIQLSELIAEYDLPGMISSVQGEYGAQNITIVNGRVHGHFLLLNYLAVKYSSIIFPEYASEGLAVRAQNIGFDVKTCPVDKNGFFDTKELSKVIRPKDVIFMYNPSEPFGMLASSQKMSRLAKLFAANDCMVISDDTTNRIIYEGKYNHIGRYYKNYATMFSLSLAMSIQSYDLAYIFSPSSDIALYTDAMVKVSMGELDPPKLAAALVWLVSDKEDFKEVVRFLKEKRDHLSETLERFGNRPVKPQAGHKILAYTDEQGIERLNRAGIMVRISSHNKAIVADFNTSLGALERARLKTETDNGKSVRKFVQVKNRRRRTTKRDQTA